MSVAEKIKPDIPKGITAQGFYVVGADGTAYGFNNNRSVERVESFLNKCLAAYRAKPATQVTIPLAEHTAAWYRDAPKGTFIADVFARIKPAPEVCDESNRNLARDHLWLTPEDGKYMVDNDEAPDAFIMRLARFHLVDNIRGEPDHWRTNEVKSATLTLTLASSSRLMKTYDLRGTFSMETADNKRGLKAQLEGRLTVNRATNHILSFDAYASGTAWGNGTYTPNAPTGKFPVVFAFVAASGGPASRFVSPQAAFYGDEYLTGR